MQNWKTAINYNGQIYVTVDEAEKVLAEQLNSQARQDLLSAIQSISSATGEIEKTVKDFKKDSKMLLG